MNGFSVGEASQMLGVSEPRIYRALAKGTDTRHNEKGHLRLSTDELSALLRRWGWVPEELLQRGLSREEIFVLAALSRSPLGLRSARSVARRASIAPGTATKALDSLSRRGLVRERMQQVVEGSVTDIGVWTLSWRSSEWKTLATPMSSVLLPAPAAAAPAQRSVPSRFAHLFWNEDTAQLDVERNGTMIAERILGSGDAEAIAWVRAAIAPSHLRRVRGLRNIPPRVVALADALAGES